MTTLAPSMASAVAMARPIPAVEPETTAFFPLRPKSIRRSSSRALSSYRCCGCAFDLRDFFRRQLQFTGAHHALSLFGVAGANNRSRDGRIAEDPGDGDFARVAAVAGAYLAQALNEVDVFGEAGLTKLGVFASEIVGWQGGSAFASHCASEEPGSHGRVRDDADALLFAIRQDFLIDLAANQGVGWLQGSWRSDFFGAF